METESHGWRCPRRHHGRRNVPSMAYDASTGCVVPQRWHDGSPRFILRYVDIPSHPILYYLLRCSTWTMAVSQPV